MAVRRDVINTTRGLVKGMGTRLPKCSTESFSKKVEGALPAEVSELLLHAIFFIGKGSRIANLVSTCRLHLHALRFVKYLSKESKAICIGISPR